MSIYNINPNNTSIEVDSNNIVWFVNSEVDIKLNLFGESSSKRDKEQKLIHFRLTRNGKKQNCLGSYVSILNAFLTGESMTGYTYMLHNTQLGYTPNNVYVCHTRHRIICEDRTIKLNKILTKLFDALPQQQKEMIEVLGVGTNPKHLDTPLQIVEDTYYTHYVGEATYTTEDYIVFNNLEEAQQHQHSVSKGKSNSNLALAHNGGYVLVEELFLNEVVYTTKHPKAYKNFIDVLTNNQGIVKEETPQYFKFDKLDDLNDLSVYCLDTLQDYVVFTKEEADKINHKVKEYSLSQRALSHAVKSLLDVLEG